MIAVVIHHPKRQGKTYRIAAEKDMEIFREAEKYLSKKREKLMAEWGMDPVPDELLPPTGTLGFRIQRYNMNTWGDLFNSRQKLALITFVEKVRKVKRKLKDEGFEEEYTKAVMSYLALAFSRLTTRNSSICVWHHGSEQTEKVFALQALPMQWSYPESNPITGENVTGFTGNINSILSVLENICSKLGFHSKPAQDSHVAVTQASATALPYNDNFFDAVFTDPPYYDNVPYSYLSDFFYVWLKRTLGNLYPELFSTPLTPKKNEIVAYSNGPGGFDEGMKYFEDMLKKSFQEIHRVLKPDGIAVIVYAISLQKVGKRSSTPC